MRKIVVLSMVTLDGVMQAPGAPEEDTSGGFTYGGWTAGIKDVDGSFGAMLGKEFSVPFDLLLGRKTYDIFAGYWPKQSGPVADPFNKAKKYVASEKGTDISWEGSVLLDGDVVSKIKALKQEDGPMLQVHGSGQFIQTLLKNDLIDELRLRIFPITLGSGKHLFREGTIPAAFELLESRALASGIIIANYKRSGEVKTGTVG